MLFNSFAFLLFFPIVTCGYFLIAHRWRWLWLLGASCFFYMFFRPVYILILAATILIDYAAGILIERNDGTRRKAWLILSLVSNLAILGFFKYFNFASENVGSLSRWLGIGWTPPLLDFVLPIGLSFHTFQAMSYTIEVFRGHQKAERHLGIYSLYVMFYPQLVAGPIERPQNLLHQFHRENRFDYREVVSGLQLMLWGLFKKVVIADRLGVVVDQVFDHPGTYSGLAVLLAMYAFAFQIFCDFSGYSDIAIGAAQTLGIRLMRNFDRPYLARSLSDFWRRWHISLSTWFKDYVYIPLGGNRVGELNLYRNIMAVFLLSGLWHGARWTFVFWGFIHGLGMVIEQGASRISLPRLPDWVARLFTFHLVVIAWVYFRATSVGAAHQLLSSLGRWSLDLKPLILDLGAIGTGRLELLVCGGCILLLEAIHRSQNRSALRPWLQSRPIWIRWPIYYGIIGAILIFGKMGSDQFIYFQF